MISVEAVARTVSGRFLVGIAAAGVCLSATAGCSSEPPPKPAAMTIDIARSMEFPGQIPAAVQADLGAVALLRVSGGSVTGFKADNHTVYTAGHGVADGCESTYVDMYAAEKDSPPTTRQALTMATTYTASPVAGGTDIARLTVPAGKVFKTEPNIRISETPLVPGEQLYALSTQLPDGTTTGHPPLRRSDKPVVLGLVYLGPNKNEPNVGYVATNFTIDPAQGSRNFIHGTSGSAIVRPTGEAVGIATAALVSRENIPFTLSTDSIRARTGIEVLNKGQEMENLGLASITFFNSQTLSRLGPEKPC